MDETTAGLLSTRFRVDRDGVTFVLRAERVPTEASPLLLGQTTPCVGRGRELSMLEGVWSGTVSEPVASAVLVVGAAGAGKSRLRRELLERLRAQPAPLEVLSGSGDALAAGSPYRIIAAALRTSAGFHESEPLEARRDKLVSRVSRHLDRTSAPRIATFLGELTHTPFSDENDEALRAARANPRIMGDAMRAAWEDWLAAECKAQPVVLTVEDLQWGDSATVRLLDSTLRTLRDLPLMVVAFARPEVFEQFPNLWSEREVQTIKLGPLSKRASEQLIRTALGPNVDPAIVDKVLESLAREPILP